jgi:predicted dehydrogenase/nucleoside-diphosphate-sugar epimerase
MQTQTEHRVDRRKDRLLRVGLIGCGRIAEHHLRFIHANEGAHVVALTDPMLHNAQRLAKRYNIEKIHSSHLEMLDSSALDVVHILTPPEFHYLQALEVINRGIHVLLEKPCTVYPHELEDLYRRAEGNRVLLCPDFIQLFNPIFLQAAALLDSGVLGNVIHINSHLSVDLNTAELRESIGLPWRYKLPGGILHDNITHPLYMTLRWLGEPNQIAVLTQSHGSLPQKLTDHLSVMLGGKSCTATIFLAGVIRPEPYYVQIFCERGNVLVNFDTSTILVTHNSTLPRSIRRATANFAQAYKLFTSGMYNAIRFARGRLLPFQGLENLVPQFYDCIRKGAEVPISKELTLAVARTEAKIFLQAGKLHLETGTRHSTQKSVSRAEKVLLTGATGYLGSVVARKLVQQGYYVRALVRDLSRTEYLEELGVELLHGDIRNPVNVMDACKEIDVAIHMAAALSGSSKFMLDCCVTGTQNLVEATKACGVKRVIYISSMSVYDSLKSPDDGVVSEYSPLEEAPQFRGTYSLAKRLAEDQVLCHLQEASPSWTILRPSVIVGNGHKIFSPVGKRIGNLLLCPGPAKKRLRLIHIEDVAAAIVTVIGNNRTQGRIFNLSAEPVSQKEYVNEFIRKSGYEDIHVVYIPYWVTKAAVAVLGILQPVSSKIPKIHKRRLASLYKSVGAKTDAITSETGWQPRDNLLQILVAEVESAKMHKGDFSKTEMSEPHLSQALS